MANETDGNVTSLLLFILEYELNRKQKMVAFIGTNMSQFTQYLPIHFTKHAYYIKNNDSIKNGIAPNTIPEANKNISSL
jgi:hypothetical protein